MTGFTATVLSLCVIGVFLTLLFARESVRVFEAHGSRRWPATLSFTIWLLAAAVALILAGRFALILTSA